MSSHDNLPGELDRKKLIRALIRLGCSVNTLGGKGSHIKIILPNEKSITIPKKLRKSALRYIIKDIETLCSLKWDQIREEL